MKNLILELAYNPVCSQLELEEIGHRLREWRPLNSKNKLFYIMKWPNHRFYRGSWGPELLMVPLIFDGSVQGYVWSTDKRAQEIRQWFYSNVFN